MQDKKMHLWRRYKWQKKSETVQHARQNARIKCVKIEKSGQKGHSTFIS